MTPIMSWNADVAYAFTLNKLLTLPLGIWPLQKYNTFSLVRTVVCGISVTTMMIMLFLEINFGSGDAYLKLDALMVISCNILAAIKLLSFRLYADNLTRTYSSAENDYLAIDTEEKRTIMRRHAFMGRMIGYSTLFFAYLASTIFMLMPMITDDEKIQVNVSIQNQVAGLPVPLTFLGDVQMSTSLYVLISVVQYIVLMLTCTSNCGNDTLFLGITLHICGQMEIVKIEFVNFGVKSKNIGEDFQSLASRHCYLMEHAELLVDVISFVLIVQMLVSCVIISMVGFQLILALEAHNAVIITKTITVLSALLLQMFFYSSVGDYLKCQMEEVADAIYTCNWYNFPLKLMRNVLFVIMRSQQPVQLLAGRFIAVNIKTYMNIIKSSLSYLSVLRVMVDT
ncbi:PREDICTED: odorant receptor 2a-like [Vollenhovia emeryi]|uniref:odorant receptor 2a-like n=1 Tax=Vollenhovia emeryi TaxID=411798 RepID=UPI0005F560DA|nr:PREDICTED: odorant receptor 2a-like [Vollenhovia emeryi]